MEATKGPWVTVKIGEQVVRALVDTGASITVIHPGVYSAMPEDIRPPIEKDEEMILKVANGETVKAHGKVTLEMDFEKGPAVRHTAYICDMDVPFIIGYDFLLRFHCVINPAENKFHVVTQKQNPRKETWNNIKGEVRAMNSEIIPAGGECCIAALWTSEEDFILEPVLLEGDKALAAMEGLWVGRGLIEPGAQVPVRILNSSNRDILVEEGTRLGLCYGVEEVRKMEAPNSESDSGNPSPSKDVTEEFETMIQDSIKGLIGEQKVVAEQFLRANSGAFIEHNKDLGRTGIYKHHIDTGDAKPVYLPPRRFPIHKREEARTEIQRMLDMGVIRPSSSPWRAAVVLVEKKGGGIRVCLDYRGLNAVTKKDKFPLPRTDDLLASLGGSQWYSTLDLASSYWQVEMNPADAEKTAFGTEDGLWEFNVLPMGLCNAGATFQRLMQLIFRGMDWRSLLIYLDDLIIHSANLEQHMGDLQEVLKRLQEAGLKLTPRKCHLFKHEVEFLGHVVNADGIKVDPKKTEAIKNWPTPKTVTEVRAFLGTTSYYRKHVEGFAQIAGPLHDLTKKRATFTWTPDCQTAMDTLKEVLTSAPILAYPREDEEFIVDTDCSQTAVGGVLSQMQDGAERPILYFSQALSKEERNYCTTRRELLAIVKTIKHCRHYLLGAKFKVRTDHGSLRWLMRFKNPEGQIARWLEMLGQYTFEIEHRAGVKHGNADGLSRRPCSEMSCNHCSRNEEKEIEASVRAIHVQPVEEQSWLTNFSSEQIAEMQGQDAELKEVRDWRKRGNKPEWRSVKGRRPEMRTYWQLWEQLEIRNEVLVKTGRPGEKTSNTKRIVAPTSIRKDVFNHLHGSKWGGHQGIARTIDAVKQRFWWPGMKRDLIRWCQTCEPCQKRKRHPHARTPLTQDQVGAPLERMACDILSFTTESAQGNVCALVVSDYFSKWAKVIPLPDHQAETVANALVTEVFLPFGVPRIMHTDQGREFQSDLLRHLYELLEVKKTRTSPYRPQSDGQVERLNRTILDMLAKFCSDNTETWDEMVPFVVGAYNATKHASTGLTPNMLFLGREISLPVDLVYGTQPPTPEASCPVEYVEKVKTNVKESFDFARDHLNKAAERQKRLYDRTAEPREFKQGDWVWRLYPPLKCKDKLNARYTGPYLIVRKLEKGIYQIQRSEKGPIIGVHVDHLKPMITDNPPESWIPTQEESLTDKVESSNLQQSTEDPTDPSRTSRRKKLPKYLDDYVL